MDCTDASFGSKRRIADRDEEEEEPPILQQLQDFSTSLSTALQHQEDRYSYESLSSLSSPEQYQQLVQEISSPSKKAKSSFIKSQEISASSALFDDLVSGSFFSDVNTEVFERKVSGSLDVQAEDVQEKGFLCDLVSGSLVSDMNGEDFPRKVVDLDVQLPETEKNQEMLGYSVEENVVCDLASESFVCDATSEDMSRKICDFDVQSQETKHSVSVGSENQKLTEETVNDVQNEVGLSGVKDFDKCGVFEESKTSEVEMVSVTEEKDETLLEAKKKLFDKIEAGAICKGCGSFVPDMNDEDFPRKVVDLDVQLRSVEEKLVAFESAIDGFSKKIFDFNLQSQEIKLCVQKEVGVQEFDKDGVSEESKEDEPLHEAKKKWPLNLHFTFRQKIGLLWAVFGLSVSIFSIVNFNMGLLATGNIIFMVGVTLIIGRKSAMKFLKKLKDLMKAAIEFVYKLKEFEEIYSFVSGFLLAVFGLIFFVMGWRKMAIFFELYSCIILSLGFWPLLAPFVHRTPGSVMHLLFKPSKIVPQLQAE